MLQAEALALVAAKTRASLMVEGKLPEEGLAALDGDGGDVNLALARWLAGSEAAVDGKAQSLEALFAKARRNEDEADELLAEGDWGDEPELPPGPIPFLVRPTPVAIGRAGLAPTAPPPHQAPRHAGDGSGGPAWWCATEMMGLMAGVGRK